jgi:hypothetical protein
MTLIPFQDKAEHDAHCRALRERGYQSPGGCESLILCPNCGAAMVSFAFSAPSIINKTTYWNLRLTYGCSGCKTFFKEQDE